jgi:hypothetical protein
MPDDAIDESEHPFLEFAKPERSVATCFPITSMGVNGNGSQTQLYVQPLIPFTLNEEWHLIYHTVTGLAF